MTIEARDARWEDFPLFQSLEESVIRRFLSMGFNFRYETGAQIVSSNDLGETFFLVLGGLAKLVLRNAQGETMGVALFRTGDFFGELSMLEPDAVRNGDIIAINDVEVAAIHKKDFLKMLHECPGLAFNLARALGQRLRLTNQRLVTQRLPDDRHKVAHTLLLLSNKGKSFHKAGSILLPPLSLKEWALFCYTSGDVFMDSIGQLKQLGILEWQNQRIVITDLDRLRESAQVHENRLT